MCSPPSSSQPSQSADSENTPGLTRNRSAFLLGMGIGEPALDDVREHLFHLSDVLPISKVLLLDSAIARIVLYDCETAALQGVGTFDDMTGIWARSYCRAREFLAAQELKLLALMIGQLVYNTRELHFWLTAGICAGNLLRQFRDQKTTPFGPAAFPVWAELRTALQTAVDRSGGRTDATALFAIFDDLARPLSLDNLREGLTRLADEICDPVPDPTQEIVRTRNRYIYDVLINGSHGQAAEEQISAACREHGWPAPGNWDQIRRIADDVAIQD